jgi:AAA domain, putative AbiEii toxin, Type IV TA system/AAA domain
MPYPRGQHPGTTWHKSDFQCHTPRDRAWIGPSTLPGGTPADEAAREAWAAGFIAECLARGISAVAITDHHDIVLAPYVQRAGAASSPPVVVYPGIEITCSDDAQCIAVFDPSADTALLQKLLLKLPGVMPAEHPEPKTCPIAPIEWTVAQLFDGAREEPHLRDNCIIFPHFSDGNAHKHLNKPNQNTRFAGLECDGVYTEKEHAELDPVTLDKAYGKIAEWGTRRRAFIVTGDSRSDTWDRLGVRGCWIKLGEPTIEAVRQALLADEARIAYSPPETPLERVVEIRIKSSLTGDDPFVISFNHGFNAFIGGRGSGKSAVLEYLRFGLARTERDLGRAGAAGREREEQLIEDTLEGGYVEVDIEREGVRETWHRDLSHNSIAITQHDGSNLEVTLSDARRRFRGRAFFQKQLSTTTRDADSATDQITGIAAAEALDRRREIDQGIDNAQRAVTTALQQLVTHWQVKLERAQAQARVADLKTRIEAITRRLAEEGVSPEHVQMIADAPRYARGRSYLGQVNIRTNAERARLEGIRGNLLAIPMEQFADIGTFPELAELSEQVDATRDRILSRIDAALDELGPLMTAYGKANEQFGVRDAEFSTAHKAAVEHQTSHRSLLDENNRLTAELAAAQEQESELSTKEITTAEAMQQFEQARAKLKELLDERYRVLDMAADQVADKSSALLKARPKHDPAPAEYIRALCGLMEGSYVQDAESKCSVWVTDALAADQEGAWTGICDAILVAYEAKIAAGQPPEAPEPIVEMMKGFLFDGEPVTDRQVARIYQNLNDATVGAVLSAVPNDYIVMTYVDEGRNIEFAKASPGQQASALLELLLRQSAGTLIIDQPEDDLDNRIIMRIVQLIRTSKNRRQLIFATHNPNIVVNGDADKIIALKSGEAPASTTDDPPRIQLLDDGAIETASIRETITHIMEGGKEAFDLRSRKYRFDAVR